MNKKIVYICPVFPFPAEVGGTQCLLKNINTLAKSKYKKDIKYLFFETKKDYKNVDLDIDYSIIHTKHIFTPSIYNKFKRFIFLFSKWTNDLSIRIDWDTDKKYIKILDPKIIILDHMGIMSLLPAKKSYKLIYIAHNIEFDFELSMAKLENNKLLKICRYIDAIKTKFLEKSILKQADKIVCISTSDYKIISQKYKDKTTLLPHKIDLVQEKWICPLNKTLFFCGAMDFYPNKEAVEWIVNKLAPILSKDIKIKIAGKGTDELPKSWQKDNIEFLGFISKEELYKHYKTSGAFICPIIYGSGVKIKVTEALSFGCPIIATKESLEGLDYIEIEPLIDRNNLYSTKENIEKLLNNQEQLKTYSKDLINQIENYQRENTNSLEAIIEECLEEQ